MRDYVTQDEAGNDMRAIYSDPRFSTRQMRPIWEYRKLIYETLVRHYTQGLTIGEINKFTGFPKKKFKVFLNFIVKGNSIRE